MTSAPNSARMRDAVGHATNWVTSVILRPDSIGKVPLVVISGAPVRSSWTSTNILRSRSGPIRTATRTRRVTTYRECFGQVVLRLNDVFHGLGRSYSRRLTWD